MAHMHLTNRRCQRILKLRPTNAVGPFLLTCNRYHSAPLHPLWSNLDRMKFYERVDSENALLDENQVFVHVQNALFALDVLNRMYVFCVFLTEIENISEILKLVFNLENAVNVNERINIIFILLSIMVF